MNNCLTIKNLTVTIEDKSILKGINLEIKKGQIHAIMGPNGSGKSTLALSLAGHPKYKTQGKIILNKTNLENLSPDKRAKLGLFIAFQQPMTIPGVKFLSFLRLAHSNLQKAKKIMTFSEFLSSLRVLCKKLSIPEDFLNRSLNDNLSGGEKKKMEALQGLLFSPKYAVFDEIDTGLDIDALKLVAKVITDLKKQGCGIIIITHYQRILKYLRPDRIHVLINGKIVKTGGNELAKELEKTGYERLVGRLVS